MSIEKSINDMIGVRMEKGSDYEENFDNRHSVINISILRLRIWHSVLEMS